MRMKNPRIPALNIQPKVALTTYFWKQKNPLTNLDNNFWLQTENLQYTNNVFENKRRIIECDQPENLITILPQESTAPGKYCTKFKFH